MFFCLCGFACVIGKKTLFCKFTRITEGEVIDTKIETWKSGSADDPSTTTKQYTTWTFVNDDTYSLLKELIHKEIKVNMIPDNIIETCISYIHNGDLRIHYGRVTKTQSSTIASSVYSTYSKGKKVRVKYNIYNPSGARITHNKEGDNLGYDFFYNGHYWLLIIAVMLGVIGLTAWYMWNDIDDINEQIRMIAMPIVILMVVGLIILVKRKSIQRRIVRKRRKQIYIEWKSNNSSNDEELQLMPR